MNDITTAQERAADLVARLPQPANSSDKERGENVAAALAAAGLLADPTTSRTEAEQAVIDAAKAWGAFAHDGMGKIPWAEFRKLRDAVERLTAPGPKEANQSRYGCDLCGTGFGHHSTSCRLAAPGPKEATP